MMLNSQPFPKSVPASVNPCPKTLRPNSWPIHSPWPQPHPCPSSHNSPCIPPCFPPIEFSSLFSVGSVATTQLRKTNPISLSPTPTQPLLLQEFTPIPRPTARKKTNPIQIEAKPRSRCTSGPNLPPATLPATRSTLPATPSPLSTKQTQFPKPQIHPKLLCHKHLPQYPTPPHTKKQTQFKSRQSRDPDAHRDPILPPLHAPRFTLHPSRFTRSAPHLAHHPRIHYNSPFAICRVRFFAPFCLALPRIGI